MWLKPIYNGVLISRSQRKKIEKKMKNKLVFLKYHMIRMSKKMRIFLTQLASLLQNSIIITRIFYYILVIK